MVKYKIKEYRIQNNLSQEELARKVNCSVRTIQNLEKEESKNSNKSIEILLKIKKALNIETIEELIIYNEDGD